MKKKSNKREVVVEYIKWVDAIGGTSEWTEIKKLEDTVVMECFSVGFVFQETKKYLLLVPHWHPSNGDITTMNGFGEIAIPKVAVLERRKLKKLTYDV